MYELVSVDRLLAGSQIIKRIGDLSLPPNVARHVADIAKFLSEEMVFFLGAQDALVRTLGELSPDKTQYKCQPGMARHGEFVAAIDKLALEEVTFPFAKIDVAVLGNLTPKETVALNFMLTGFDGNQYGHDAVALMARQEQLVARQGETIT